MCSPNSPVKRRPALLPWCARVLVPAVHAPIRRGVFRGLVVYSVDAEDTCSSISLPFRCGDMVPSEVIALYLLRLIKPQCGIAAPLLINR